MCHGEYRLYRAPFRPLESHLLHTTHNRSSLPERKGSVRAAACAGLRVRAVSRVHIGHDAITSAPAACNVRLRRAAPGGTTSRSGVGKVQDQRVRIRIIVEQTPVLRLEFLPQGPTTTKPSPVCLRHAPGAGGGRYCAPAARVLWRAVQACEAHAGAVDVCRGHVRRIPQGVGACVHCFGPRRSFVANGPTVAMAACRGWARGVPGTVGAAGAGPPARPSPRSTPVATPTRAAASTQEPAAGSAAART